MQSKLFCLLVFALTTLAQIVPNPNAADANPKLTNSNPSGQQKAMQYLLRSYPQLRNDNNILSISANRTSNHRTKLQDSFFTFQLNSTRISVIVTLCQSFPGQFISISPLVTIDGDNFTSSETENQESNYYIISNQEVRQGNTNRTVNSRSLGSFEAFTDRTDPRLDCALAFVDSLHPLMVNYKVETIEYQVVSGINFLLDYTGDDGFTKISAMVNVDLNLQPNLLSFFVHCPKGNDSTISLSCNNSLAFQIFAANEALLIMRPELINYELISMDSDDNSTSDGVLFVLTFQDSKEKTRVMVELNINGNVFSILAFYTYAYPQ